jgi:hypothetical protein
VDDEWTLDDMEGIRFSIERSNIKSIYCLAHIEENLQDQFVQEALTQVNNHFKMFIPKLNLYRISI